MTDDAMTIAERVQTQPAAPVRGRLVSLFGRIDRAGRRRLRYVTDSGSDYVATEVDAEQPVPSIAAEVPAASWYEREAADQFGIRFTGSPDPRRLLFHECWPEDVHPMIQRMNAIDWPAPGDTAAAPYPFLRVGGEGVCEVPVGPVHAGIIEPGHFRFSVMGDTVLHLELRHFYTHKGTERLFRGCPVAAGPMLAESVSGDNCFAHAVAYCQAVETAFEVEPPPRALAIRLIGLELERLLAHAGDFGALCNDIGFSVAAARGAALKERLLQASTAWMGTRYWRGIAAPGGVRRDVPPQAIDAFRRAVAETASGFAELARVALDAPSLQDRFDGAGVLQHPVARDLAVVGPAARASNAGLDVRQDHPYGAYRGLQVRVPTFHYGDVMARARIRVEEAAISAELIEQVLGTLPAGPLLSGFDAHRRAEGYSAIESPRGELMYWLEADEGYVSRCHIKSPSFQNWPALPFAVSGNIIADFPLINKSFNLSYSGADR